MGYRVDVFCDSISSRVSYSGQTDGSYAIIGWWGFPETVSNQEDGVQGYCAVWAGR